jgi:membrane protease YdiL (CAAX protease family)
VPLCLRGSFPILAQQLPKPKTEAPPVQEPSTKPPRITSQQWKWLQIAVGVLMLAILWFGNVIKPSALGGAKAGSGSGGGGGGGGGGGQPWWAMLFAALVIYIAMALGAQAMTLQVQNQAWPFLEKVATDSTKGKAFILLANFGAGLLAGGAMLALAIGGLKRPSASQLGLGVLAILVLFPIVNATGLVSADVYQLIKSEPPPKISHTTLQTLTSNRHDTWAWVQIGCAVLLAPIVEEIIYRYFLQNALAGVLGRAWLAIVIGSALFAAAHVGAVPLQALPMLFVLGLGLGVAVQRTGSLAVPIVMHMVFNAANVALAVWG